MWRRARPRESRGDQSHDEHVGVPVHSLPRLASASQTAASRRSLVSNRPGPQARAGQPTQSGAVKWRARRRRPGVLRCARILRPADDCLYCPELHQRAIGLATPRFVPIAGADECFPRKRCSLEGARLTCFGDAFTITNQGNTTLGELPLDLWGSHAQHGPRAPLHGDDTARAILRAERAQELVRWIVR